MVGGRGRPQYQALLPSLREVRKLLLVRLQGAPSGSRSQDSPCLPRALRSPRSLFLVALHVPGVKVRKGRGPSQLSPRSPLKAKVGRHSPGTESPRFPSALQAFLTPPPSSPRLPGRSLQEPPRGSASSAACRVSNSRVHPAQQGALRSRGPRRAQSRSGSARCCWPSPRRG